MRTLTLSNLVEYLQSRSIIDVKTPDSSPCRAETVFGWYRNFRVTGTEHAGCFVKQVRVSDERSFRGLAIEALCYQMAHSSPVFEPLAQSMPRCLDYDPVNHVLIVELFPNAENLGRYDRDGHEIPLHVWKTLGRTLASCHSQVGRDLAAQFPQHTLQKKQPGILRFHLPDNAFPRVTSEANRALRTIVRTDQEFARALDEVREQWIHDSFVHADMKWSNVVLFPLQRERLQVRIVDWECADLGEAGWDVAGVLQNFLVSFIMSVPVTGSTLEMLIKSFGFELRKWHPGAKCFWNEYVSERQLDDSAMTRLLRRTLRLTAVRLLQSAVELMYQKSQLSPQGQLLFEMSREILNAPEEQGRRLLGLNV